MSNQENIFEKLKLRKKPKVPDNFFEKFHTQLHCELLDSSLPAKTEMEVPNNFFENFKNELDSAIFVDESFESVGIKKSKKPVLPQGFESDFKSKLMHQLETPKKQKNGKLIIWSFVTSAAAVALILFQLFKPNEVIEQPIGTIAFVEIEDTKHIDQYMAYIDESTIIDFILETELEIYEDDIDDEIYDYINQDIEEYYIDL